MNKKNENMKEKKKNYRRTFKQTKIYLYMYQHIAYDAIL